MMTVSDGMGTMESMFTVSYSLAFIAGIVSFLSPCILPIVPGFLAYLAGSTAASAGASRRDTFLNAVAFVAGFSLVFAVLGILLQTALATVAYDVRIWLSRIGGILIIAFGLYLTRIIRIPFLEVTRAASVSSGGNRNRYLTSALFGAAFATGWTPCVGAVLGAILTLAVTSPASAFTLMLAYSVGLGVPFLLFGLFAAGAQSFVDRYTRAMSYVSVAFGVILILLGVLVFTQDLGRIANFEFLNRIILRY